MKKIRTVRYEEKTVTDETIEELQAELLRLQRQFRLLEEDRRAYREETEYVLRKQRDSINNLNEEHTDLDKEYKLASSAKNQNFDRQNVDKLRILLEEEEEVKVAMRAEMQSNTELTRKIKDIKQTVHAFRKKMGGCNASGLRCKAMIKQNRVMENRLNKASVKFNTALSENSELREEINHINAQRIRFTELQEKLSKLMSNGKEEKEKLIEQSTLLFNSRDEAEHRMHSLRERSERDMNQFNSELKDLLRVIDHDKKLREFMRTKMEERSEIYENAVNGRNEKKLLNYVKTLQVELQHYESIFNELVQVSGTPDIDQMVDKFIQIEDQNFALFTFVKEQSQEIQANEAGIVTLDQQIESMHKEDVYLESKHKVIQKRLEESERNNTENRTKINTKLKNEQKILSALCVKIDSMLKRINCDRSAMTELLAGSKITNENLASYLGLIEQKGTELLQARALILLRNGGDGPKDASVAEPKKEPVSFATVGRIARYLMRMPSINDDIPEIIATSADYDPLRPISQRQARELLVAQVARTDIKSQQSSMRVEKK